MPPRRDAIAAIRQCINRCAMARDGRGLFQAERALQLQLARDGSATVAVQVSGAARRIGQWLAGQGAWPAADAGEDAHASTVGADAAIRPPTHGGGAGVSVPSAGDANG